MIPIIQPNHGPSSAKRDGRIALVQVDALIDLGADVDFPEVDDARDLYARARDVLTEAATLARPDLPTLHRNLGADYVNGALDLDGVIDAAVRLETGATSTVKAILDQAAANLSAQAGALIAGIGDDWITQVLRPLVDATLGPMADVAAAIPAGYYIDDLGLNRHTRSIQDAWVVFGRMLDDLQAVHDVADQMRCGALIPATSRPSEYFRWGRPDLIDQLGGPNGIHKYRWLVAYHNGAQPGIYTEQEVTDQTTGRDASEAA